MASKSDIGEETTELVRSAKRSVRASKWHRDAKQTMLENPDYFVWWYTVKSVGLGVAVALGGYFLGKSRGLEIGAKFAGRHED